MSDQSLFNQFKAIVTSKEFSEKVSDVSSTYYAKAKELQTWFDALPESNKALLKQILLQDPPKGSPKD